MRMPQAEARKRLSALGLEEEKSLTAEAAIASEVSREGGRRVVFFIMHDRSRTTIGGERCTHCHVPGVAKVEW